MSFDFVFSLTEIEVVARADPNALSEPLSSLCQRQPFSNICTLSQQQSCVKKNANMTQKNKRMEHMRAAEERGEAREAYSPIRAVGAAVCIHRRDWWSLSEDAVRSR